MERFLGRYSTYIYAVFRIVFGFMFMLHGMQKLFNVPPAKQSIELSGLVLVAAIIEFGGGLLIMIGLFSSIAAFLSSGTMAFAYFMAHQPNGALPIMNGGELAVAYCFAFLYIASRGSGVWSVESMFKGSGSAAANGG